jgi:catechol 2,3-dioxygenase-like lactoylglutathione lyase family enzyme
MHSPLSPFPLPSAKVCAFAATTDAARCRDFYVGKLGLRLMHEDGYGIVLDSGGTMVRIQKGPDLTPVPRTVLGWNVADIEQAVKGLAGAGVAFERFTWFQQDENGITTFPDGARVAWFKDPDGNILALVSE